MSEDTSCSSLSLKEPSSEHFSNFLMRTSLTVVAGYSGCALKLALCFVGVIRLMLANSSVKDRFVYFDLLEGLLKISNVKKDEIFLVW